MLLRFFTFLAFQLAGACAGWYGASWMAMPWDTPVGVTLGLVLGGVAWFLFDMTRSLRFLRWLRRGDVAEVAMRTGVWGEISERTRRLVRHRDQQVRDSDQRLHDFLAAFQASPNGVVLLDAEGRIEWFNQMATSHFGFEAARDMAQHFGNLVRDPGFAGYFAAQDFDHELLMPGRGGTSARPVKLSVQLHPYGEGRLLLLSRDVTAVEQAEAMRRDFVANVSHEIRTPLTVLGGFVETLQTLDLDAHERERYLALMAQQADRMQTLVSDLLTLSRLEGSLPPSLTDWVDAPELMQLLEHEGRGLSAVMHPDTAHPPQELVFESRLLGDLAGSSRELLSAMGNLVGNAIRYTPAGGRIQVTLVLLPDGRAEFSVSDTGPGIAPEHLPRLTERFYRVDRSRSRDTGGTGLGLAIVKHVAQRHGAELKIVSSPGKGAIFSILFPASRVRLKPVKAVARLSVASA